MRATLKELGFAVFFLVVIALVAVQAAEAAELVHEPFRIALSVFD